MGTTLHGVNVDQLVGTVKAIKENPDLARFRFRAVTVESLRFALEGDIDLQGFLGLSDRVRLGYQNIRLSCTVRSDAPREKLEELWEYVQRTSPVLDIVRNPVPVSLAIENA